MRKTKNGLSVVACLAAAAAITPAAFGQETIIYDNSSQYLGSRTTDQNAEIGDVVTFAPSSTDRLLSEFSFEYFATTELSGNETAQVFIRSVVNDVVPDEIIFQTAPFSIVSGFRQVVVDGLNTSLPETVAWTVRFSGFEGAEEAGLLYYNGGTGTVGSNPTFNGTQFMIRAESDGSFSFLDTPGVVDNLGARFTAIPEPTTWALILGGLAGFGLLRRRSS
jgi:hypothetical protein